MINQNTIIRFVNRFQNGDIFISSKFIIDIKKKLPHNNIIYYIKLTGENAIDPRSFNFLGVQLYNIFENMQYEKQTFMTFNIHINEIIINTHCGNYTSKFDCNRQVHCEVYIRLYYELFEELYKFLNLKLESIEYYIPSFILPNCINENISYISTIYKNIQKRKVLICTGKPFSESNKTLNSNTISDIILFFINNNFFVKVTHEEFIIDDDTIKIYKNQLILDTPILNNNSILTKTRLTFEENEIFASNSEFVVGMITGNFFNTMTSNTLNTTFLFITDVTYRLYEKFNVINIDRNNIINDIANAIK